MSRHVVRMLWLLNAAAVLLMLVQPVSTTVQLEMSLAAIGMMTLLWAFGKGRTSHYVFLAIGSLIVLKYLYWRLTSTLPPTSDPLNFGAGLLLLIAELYCFYILFVSLIINADPLQRKSFIVHDDNDLPTIDVFVPSYNEDHIILSTTLSAAKSLDYPSEKLTVWLLDDGGTEQKCTDPDPIKSKEARTRRNLLQHLCKQLDVRYLTRRVNVHAKAGNLNNGLQHSSADIVVVFDADHVPFSSFLRETVGYFARDEKLFLVQTPHAFINPDPIERNLQTFERMPSENEMFYSITQSGLDKWNGSFFCGSAALLRRTALEEAGGFAGITITEDCETAFDLHSRGWTSVFVDKPLIAGLQPETLAAFIGQRSRWCQGMLQIMLLKNPLFKRGLKPLQRLSYLSSMTFWFFPIPRLIFMFAPLLYIFFDMKVVVANVDEAIAFTATYILVNLMLQNYLYGRVRWPFISELYEYVQGLYLIKATLAVLISPRTPKFNVTAKNINLDRDHLSSLAIPYFAVYAILFLVAVISFYRYFFEPGITNLMLVVGLWNLFNLITAGVALGVVAERRQKETAPSLAIDRKAVLRINEQSLDVRVKRISNRECWISTAAIIPNRRAYDQGQGMLFAIPMDSDANKSERIASIPVKLSKTTMENEETICQFTFQNPDPRHYLAIAELMYGDSRVMEQFQQRRRQHKNLFTGTLQFIFWGLIEPLRAFSYLFRTKNETVKAPKSAVVQKRLEQEKKPALPTRQHIESLPHNQGLRRSDDKEAVGEKTTGSKETSWVELFVQADKDALLNAHSRRASDQQMEKVDG